MTQWWEIDTPQLPGAVPKFRAVAYYRHSGIAGNGTNFFFHALPFTFNPSLFTRCVSDHQWILFSTAGLSAGVVGGGAAAFGQLAFRPEGALIERIGQSCP